MTAENIAIIVAMVLYLCMTIVIGFKFSKINRSSSDFYLGGRRLGPLVTAMSAEASDMSSWLLMGLPGVAYLSGLADPLWTTLGLGIGTYLNWLFVAKRIRRYSEHVEDAFTVPDFISNRFGDSRHVLSCIAAIVIIVFFIPYTASGFAACGKLFSSLFGADYVTAMIISAAVIVAYTTLGGFLAASTTDLIQSIVMSVALIVVLGYGTYMAGGLDQVMQNAQSLPGYLGLTTSFDPSSGESSDYSILTIISTLAWGLGYFGMPHILLRFMAIKDDNKLKLSRRIATVWVFIAMACAIMIGIIGLAVTHAGHISFLEGSASENIIVQIASLLSQNGVLPALIAGIIMAGILAATMSTADSQLLTAASSVSHNLIYGVLGIKMSPMTGVIIARISVVGISVIAVFLAMDPNSNVFQIVSFAWAGFGAAFGPVILTALYWKRANKYGALAGMIVGGSMVFIWKFLVRPLGGVWNIYELLPAFLLALAAIALVSMVTPPPSDNIVKKFEEVEAMG